MRKKAKNHCFFLKTVNSLRFALPFFLQQKKGNQKSAALTVKSLKIKPFS